ncbi:beta-1,3-N-acetylglucosaminyltransferase manic fringe [Rhineura floridana]|uniref:beta-1,3-N-acetylglucosaminyltransferase manic fringe n=1 Tax=Rhineura floridana TaxID=261503 RepID=UPI002AC80F5F|nr:beta-1,3-N-acetylglucosaminyltransferase manic fringe [Rhineura floridana]
MQAAMRRQLIRDISGVVLFLVSMVLLSMRHYGVQEADDYQRLAEGISGSWAQWGMTLVVATDQRRSRKTEHGKQIKGHGVVPGEGLLLEELFIAVKTTQKFHQSRMGLLLDTWISQVKEQTYVFTDKDDDELQEKLGQLATGPSATRKTRQALFKTPAATSVENCCMKIHCATIVNKNFLITSELIHLPDYCTVGYIIEYKLAGHLVPSALFHSHLENLHLIQNPHLTKQVTLSYGTFEKKLNVIKLSGPFPQQDDPSRF